jgi:hypothetical protein
VRVRNGTGAPQLARHAARSAPVARRALSFRDRAQDTLPAVLHCPGKGRFQADFGQENYWRPTAMHTAK